MSITLAHLERLKRIHDFVQKENTGNPTDFAKLLFISVRTLQEDLNILKEWGGKVEYNRKNQTYYYLDQFSARFPLGKVTAIVGESGSGKSTLVSLLQKLYPLNDGTIFIGEQNLQYITEESLKEWISVVPQHIDLFAGNVIDNIAVGEFVPNMERMVEICKSIGILSFIEQLPNGFNTYLGEHGASLSGGEKQRIAIARALYQQPEILILDEATSSLDSQAEQHIKNTIRVLKEEQKTIVLIAHRLSTVVQADQILVMKNGKLIESGHHTELIEKDGPYHQLWQQQMLT